MQRRFNAVRQNFSGQWKRMHRQGSLCLLALVFVVTFLAGCHGDPALRRQKYLESGNRYSVKGDYSDAVVKYQNALKVDDNFAEAHYQLALAYVHLGQVSAAYAEFVQTVDLQPENYNARLDLGNMALAAGRIDDAQTQAEAVIAAQPNSPDVHALLSAIAFKRGQKEQALAEIQRALEIDPNRAALHDDLALLQEGDPSKSPSVEEQLKKSVALDPASVNAKVLLATFYARNNRWPEAEQAASDAVATDPRSLSARASQARVFFKEGNQVKGEQVLRQASSDLSDNPLGVRMLADYYAGAGQLDKAKAEFAALAAKYPRNISVQKGYLRVLLQVKDYATAKTVLAGLMKSRGNDPEVAALNGIMLLEQGKAAEAVSALQEAVKNSPKDAYTFFWLGKAALDKGDTELAERSFRQAAELNPSAVESQQELARIAGMRGDIALLSDVSNKTIAAAPGFEGGYVWRAIVEMSRNAPDKAEADLNIAIGIAPRSPQACLELAKVRFAQDRPREGAALLEQVLEYDPNSIPAMQLLVSYDLSQHQPDKALDRLNAEIAKNPGSSSLYDLLAQVQIQSKNLDQASASVQKAIRLDSQDGEAVMLFAQIQALRGQTATAVETWEHWSNAHPRDAGAMAILGALEESRGNRTQAEADYRKALQIEPQQPIAANNLAYLMLQNGGNVDEALSLALTARRSMSNSPDAADTLAWAYYYKGFYAFARDLLEDAVKTDPTSAEMQYHLGTVYSKLGNKNNAAIHLKRALSLSPDSAIAKDARAALQGLG